MLSQKRASYPVKYLDSHRHIAAILTTKNGILGVGPNIMFAKTAPHAEASAMANAERQLYINGKTGHRKRVNLLVVRDDMKNSRPCAHCISDILNSTVFNVHKVYYTVVGPTGTLNIAVETKADLMANCDHHISIGHQSTDTDEDDADPQKSLELAHPTFVFVVIS